MSKVRDTVLLICFIVGLNVMVVSAADEVPTGEEPLTPEQLEAYEAELVRPAVAECTSDILVYLSPEECQALADLYNNTGGERWLANSFSSYNVPWFTTDYPCNWMGIDCGGSNSSSHTSSITSLNLNNRELRGTLSESLGNLTNLRALHLTNNRLAGEIPATIGNLSNVTTVALRDNSLSGEIPATIGNLTGVRWLHLENNFLEGSIPAEIANLTELQSLDLSLNQLTGDIPAGLGDLLFLEYLHLHDNFLNGTIPVDFSNLRSIEQIELSRNDLTGTIPAELGSLDVREFFKAKNNQLNGAIPPELELFRGDELDLSSNQLVGPLPANLSDFRVSYRLDLSRNLIDGALPADLTLARPDYINLEHNQLTGEMDVNDVFGSNFDVDYNRLHLVGTHSLSYYYSTPQIVPSYISLIGRNYPSDPLTTRFTWYTNPYRTRTPHAESELQYATSPEGPWTTIETGYGKQHWLTFPEYDTTYYVRVRTRDFNSGVVATDSMWTEYSDTIEMQTMGSAPPIMEEQYHLNPYEDPYTARVFWGNTSYNHQSGHYTLSYALSPDGPWFENAVVTDSRNPYGAEITFPEPDTRYYVRMQSVTAFPSGDLVTDHSNIIDVKTGIDRFAPIPTISTNINQHTIIMDRYYFTIAATLLAIATFILIYPQKQDA